MPESAQQPYLEIHTPEGRRSFPIGPRAVVTLGRHPENNVIVTDPLASRRHCVIERAPEGWRLRDLNSSNGTRVNGQISTLTRLLPGDIVSIGQTKIVLVIPTAAAAARPAPRAPNKPAAVADDVDVIDADDLVDADDEPGLEEIEELADAEVIEDDAGDVDVLTEDDLVDVDADPDERTAIDPPPYRDEGRIRVDVGGGDDDGGASSDTGAYLQSLREMAESLPTKQFGEYDIATINSRGVVVHPAAPPDRKNPKQDAVEILRLLLLVVARSRATDIHMEPKGEHYQLRIRIDGIMVDVARFPNEIGVKLNALVKIMGDIDMTQKSIVQEGHFAAKVPGRRIDYRISFAPSVFGQKLVIRVQDTALAPVKVADLKLPDWMRKEVDFSLEQDQGMVLVCGPTGSGKTTTLYTLLRSSDTASKNVVTIEDPVEIQIEGVTQLPVDESEGKSFSALLKSVLRQDPDTIMVGEIRDPETARIAMQAAITGHMVFSTVHTTGTVGTIFRLLDLCVEPYLIAQGLHLILAQRLVRQLCPYCKRATKPTPEQAAKLPEGTAKLFAPQGCPRCLSTGFSGRRAFFELLHTTEALREVISRNPTMAEINKMLAETKFVKLQQAGFQLVADGVVAYEEIERAVGR
ncbi:MAG: ATPase, T2SS/T4P/T4SS family [Phycisphaerae bacterium]